MSTSQFVTEAGLADSVPQATAEPADAPRPPGASRLLKGLLIGFALSVTIGLALTSWYVGTRIVASNGTVEAPKVTAPAVVAPVPVVPTPRLPAPDLYLQVAGLGPLRDASFVKRMEAQGYRARFRRGPQLERQILIGPFAERSSLEEEERRLQSDGVLAVEAAH